MKNIKKLKTMKNIILTTIAVLVSLLTFSQNHLKVEKMIFDKVNELRKLNGVDKLDFSPIAYKLAKNISDGVYDSTGINMDTILVKPYGVSGVYISFAVKLYSVIDGRKLTEHEIVDVIMELCNNDIENMAYLLISFDLGNGGLYSGGISSSIDGDKCRYTLVIHEKK